MGVVSIRGENMDDEQELMPCLCLVRLSILYLFNTALVVVPVYRPFTIVRQYFRLVEKTRFENTEYSLSMYILPSSFPPRAILYQVK